MKKGINSFKNVKNINNIVKCIVFGFGCVIIRFVGGSYEKSICEINEFKYPKH